MPHANIWIRKENEESWRSLDDKSAWVNEKLEETKGATQGEKTASKTVNEGSTPSAPAKLKEAKVSGVSAGVKLCEHGQAKGRCLTPSCKFSRYKKGA